jgi:hypothetical protein
LVTAKNALAALFKAPPNDPLAQLGAGILANALINLELIARAHGKGKD